MLIVYRTELSAGTLDDKIVLPLDLNLGELQSSFQVFHQEYLRFMATQQNGHFLKQRAYLEKDLIEINQLKNQILEQRDIQDREYKNAEERFGVYEQLYTKNVISKHEYKQEESKYLASKHPLQQNQAAILNNISSYAAKQKELLDLNHAIEEQKAGFLQSLNNLVTQVEAWQFAYIIKAPFGGQVNYAGIIQENQNITVGDELFVINPGNTAFFGEIQIPQYNMGKVGIDQKVLIKLHSYPFEQFGMIRGKVSYISDVAYRDSVFIAKVNFGSIENKNLKHPIVLKNGMQAEAEIITEDSTLLQRVLMNIRKMMNSQ